MVTGASGSFGDPGPVGTAVVGGTVVVSGTTVVAVDSSGGLAAGGDVSVVGTDVSGASVLDDVLHLDGHGEAGIGQQHDGGLVRFDRFGDLADQALSDRHDVADREPVGAALVDRDGLVEVGG